MMSIERWEPFGGALRLRDAMDRLLAESVVWLAAPRGDGDSGLALDLEESPDAYTVRAALPGFRPEEIEANVLGDALTIAARRQREEERREGQYLIRERRAGAVSRTLTLPGPVDADKARARHEHGELVLTLPKAAGSARRRIPIGGAYQYGYEAGGDARYRDREFTEAEADLRREYEHRERAAGRGIAGLWERLREEIRAGWDRARGK